MKLPITCRGNELISEVHTQITGFKSPNGQARPGRAKESCGNAADEMKLCSEGNGPPCLEDAASCFGVDTYSSEKKKALPLVMKTGSSSVHASVVPVPLGGEGWRQETLWKVICHRSACVCHGKQQERLKKRR